MLNTLFPTTVIGSLPRSAWVRELILDRKDGKLSESDASRQPYLPPYIIGRRMWHPEHSKAAYPTREQLMTDCVPILRQEIELLREAGADTVQLDEPYPMDIDEAYLKLKAMCQAAKLLREKYA